MPGSGGLPPSGTAWGSVSGAVRWIHKQLLPYTWLGLRILLTALLVQVFFEMCHWPHLTDESVAQRGRDLPELMARLEPCPYPTQLRFQAITPCPTLGLGSLPLPNPVPQPHK